MTLPKEKSVKFLDAYGRILCFQKCSFYFFAVVAHSLMNVM